MSDKIKCPNCGHNFDVEEALSGQLKAKFQQEFEQRIAAQTARFNKEKEALEAKEKEFELKKQKENELFQERLQKSVEAETVKIQKEQQEAVQAQLQALQEENDKRKEENRQLKTKEIELLQRENQLKEKAEEQQLQLQKQLLEEKTKIEEEGRKKEREANELKEKEYQKQLEDQKKLIEEMKRKAEQGSMQLQGEVQELAIEEYLQIEFPFDTIDEIKKGITGADCIQYVNTREFKNCGAIYYESKRTKSFNDNWIVKLKKDMQTASAAIGVIVTEAMPPDMDRMGMKDGIWVCNFNEFKGLAKALRQSLIMLRKTSIVQENKGDKMSMLYDFLTSQEFRMQIETIVDGFTQMKSQLEAEKRAFQRQWKEREKQIDRVTENTVAMYGSIKGIAGKSVPKIDRLEFPGWEELED